jgi:ribonuclease P protein component
VAGETAARPFRPSVRLHQPREYAAVLAATPRRQRGCFELRYLPGPVDRPGPTRLGLVIPKRLARHAVLRNLLKRLAREAFRQALPVLPAGDIVLRLAKPPVAASGPVDGARRALWRSDIDSLLAALRR